MVRFYRHKSGLTVLCNSAKIFTIDDFLMQARRDMPSKYHDDWVAIEKDSDDFKKLMESIGK